MHVKNIIFFCVRVTNKTQPFIIPFVVKINIDFNKIKTIFVCKVQYILRSYRVREGAGTTVVAVSDYTSRRQTDRHTACI